MDEKRYCPHCHQELTLWLAPPDSGWGEILVCFNNECVFYKGSRDDILHKSADMQHLGCRYAENPDNGYKPFNLLAICK